MNAVLSSVEATESRSLVRRLADRFGVDAGKLLSTLKATCFKVKDGEATNEQMQALLIVADQYRLNPFTREIFAFPDKQNGIVPVVSVDGWSRIINEHPQFDGLEFRYSEETVEHKGKRCHVWIECVIYRKDRTRPTIVREYFSEVARSMNYTTPWDTHPNRMHRHKALIQCARVAFGFAGIYDEDEAERIVEARVVDQPRDEARQESPKAIAYYPQEQFEKNMVLWKSVIESGRMTAEQVISRAEARNPLTKEQKAAILALEPKPQPPAEDATTPEYAEWMGEGNANA